MLPLHLAFEIVHVKSGLQVAVISPVCTRFVSQTYFLASPIRVVASTGPRGSANCIVGAPVHAEMCQRN